MFEKEFSQVSATPRVCKCSSRLSLFSSRLASHASPPYLKCSRLDGPSNREAKGEGLSGTSVLRQQRPPSDLRQEKDKSHGKGRG